MRMRSFVLRTLITIPATLVLSSCSDSNKESPISSGQAALSVVLRGPTCEGCALTATEIATIRDDIALAKGQGYQPIARDGSGRFYLTSSSTPGRIVVYDSAGKQIAQIGRNGKGPGEYMGPMVTAIGDTIHVFDVRLKRRTVLSPSLQVVRVVPVPIYAGLPFPLPNDAVLWKSSDPTQAGSTPLLAVADSSGRVIRQFGPTQAPSYSSQRTIGRPRNERVWLGSLTRYTVEQWDFSGTRRKMFERNVEWFPSFSDYPSGAPAFTKPPAELLAVNEDREGLLWTLISVPDMNWKAHKKDPKNPNEVYPTLGDVDDIHDTMLEVIDPERGEVLVSKRFPQSFFPYFVDDGILYNYTQDDAGVLTIHIFRISLTGR
jgi:hypothetical protein